MKFYICIKMVPDVYAPLQIKEGELIMDADRMVLNAYDASAVEEALVLKEKHGGEVEVVCIGPAKASETIRKALAMGADKATHILAAGDEEYDSASYAKILSAFFKDKEVIVVGGGDSAMEEALFLTKFASKITVVHRRDKFRASKIMQDKLLKNEKISVIWDTVVEEILGDGKFVTGAKLKNVKTNEIEDFSCQGVFLAIGHIPNTKFLQGLLETDKLGYLKTDRFTKTNVPGIFAAGDVQDTRYRQAVTAAGSGCKAAMEVEKYLDENE